MSNLSLIERLKKLREFVVEIDEFKFTLSRPSDLDIIELRGRDLPQSQILKRYVKDWGEMKESQIISGGTPEKIDFDSELFIEWIADKPNLIRELVHEIITAYQTHSESLDIAIKKPSAG
jgi:hypothetical protein